MWMTLGFEPVAAGGEEGWKEQMNLLSYAGPLG